MVTLRGEGLVGTCVPRPALRGQNLTEVPLGTYRSSSAPRSSWSQGNCCLRPHSSRPQRSGLGCSHLWVWQKEMHSGQMQADSGGRAGEDPPYRALLREQRVALLQPLGQGVGSPSHLFCSGAPHALCVPVTRNCPDGPCHTSRPRSRYSFAFIFSQRTPTHLPRPSSEIFRLTFPGKKWSALLSVPRALVCVDVCLGHSLVPVLRGVVSQHLGSDPLPALPLPPFLVPRPFCLFLTHLPLFVKVFLLSLCNYKGGNGLEEVIRTQIKVNTTAAYAEFSQHIPTQGAA